MSQSGPYLMSFDIGTSGGKAAIFDLSGRALAIAHHEYQFEHPHSGWSELNPETVWRCVCQSAQDCLKASQVDPRNIAAIGLSALGETGLAVDSHGQAVYPIIESMDRRDGAYQQYVYWFAQRFGSEAIYKRTSYPLNSLPPIHKMLWLRDHRPEVFARMAKYISLQEYFIWRMTGQPAVDYSIASRTMLFDVAQKQWIQEYFTEAGLSTDLVSPAVPSSQVVGLLNEEAAREMGLVPGIQVVPGAHDQACSALGIGIIRPGVAGDGTGSVEAIVTVSGQPLSDPQSLAIGVGSQCHITSNTYLVISFHLAAGSLVRWYTDQFGTWAREPAQTGGRNVYDLITEEAQTSPPGSNGVVILPHWSGAGTGRTPPLDPASRGAVFGLTLAHTRADVSRAIFEGITYESRFLLESLETPEAPIRAMIVTGGGAKSPFWLQLKANITGKTIVVPRVTEASLLGAAMLAGTGAGLYADIQQAVEEVCQTESVYQPEPSAAKVYQPYYEIYRDLYDSTIGVHSRLAKIL